MYHTLLVLGLWALQTRKGPYPSRLAPTSEWICTLISAAALVPAQRVPLPSPSDLIDTSVLGTLEQKRFNDSHKSRVNGSEHRVLPYPPH